MNDYCLKFEKFYFSCLPKACLYRYGKKVVSLVVLTNSIFCFSLLFSLLKAMAIPVRGARF
ncbi:hypothetical protein CDR68_19785 [Salmonella enterica]|nr:hypothetical protein [Salmonella enterica subsp. indica serovar 11:b:e,n,x]EBS7635963.1 hypothetical protein [Salmonella enterica]